MRLFDLGVIIFLVVVGVVLAGGIISNIWLPNDNAIEEMSEEILKKETGIDVDLTPNSPETQQKNSSNFRQKNRRLPDYV